MKIPEIDCLRLVSVVDNGVDLLLADDGPALRRPRGPNEFGERCLCAEHGLAWVVESRLGGERFSLLCDFGGTPLVYLHNLALLLQDYRLNLGSIRALVLSHGHWDHYGGLASLLAEHRRELPRELSLYAGEDAFLHRWRVTAEGERRDMGRLDEASIRATGIRVVKVKSPEIVGGQALLSGEIARATPYETSPAHWRMTRDGTDVADAFAGEQALVYHLRGKGLVVLTGCAHAGVVNTVRHAREVTGVDRVHAIVGGFHLSGAAPERIAPAVEDLAAFDPDFVVPMHCTGMRAVEALDRRLPGRVVLNSTGTRYEFGARAPAG